MKRTKLLMLQSFGAAVACVAAAVEMVGSSPLISNFSAVYTIGYYHNWVVTFDYLLWSHDDKILHRPG